MRYSQAVVTYDAILPAGGRIEPDFAKRTGTDVKALIRLQDETILDRTVRILKETGKVGRIVVVGGSDVRESLSSQAGVQILDEGASGPDNIMRALRFLLAEPNPPDKVLIVTTDLPFLDAEHIERFISLCPEDRDISIPLITRAEWQKSFPNSTATFVKLADGEFTTGCAYLVNVSALQSSMPQIERAFKNRKSVIGLARLLGPRFLFRFVTKTLNLPDIELKIQSMLGCTGKAVRDVPAELAYDIDALDDYDYALARIQS